MNRLLPWLLSAVFGALWWCGRRAKRAKTVVLVPRRERRREPAHTPQRRFPNEDPGLRIAEAEPGSAHLGARRRWMWAGAGIVALGLTTLVLSAAYNRIPVTPDPNAQTGIPADGPSTWTALAGADPARAPALFRSYGCVGCHVIPGIPGAYGHVGPNLNHLFDHALIAGVLENTPENLVHWIRVPQQVDPRTGMPNLGVKEQDGLDMATYLQTFK